jgi:hypothetical protein
MDVRARARWAASGGGALVLALAIVGTATSRAEFSLAAPNAILDQSNPARPSACRYVGWAPDSANEWVAETFTAGVSGSLTDVVLWLAVSNPQNPVAISAVDASGRPDVATTLTSTTLAVDGSTTFKAVGVSFPTPAGVEAGKQYALVLYAPVRDAWGWQADLGSSLPDPDGKPCGDGANTGGRLWLSSDSSFAPDGDFFFQTYVVPARHVTVQKTGTGTGLVKDGSHAIDCGAACTGEFAEGGTATLTATADAGSTFSGWAGGGCTGTAPACAIPVSGDVSVTAMFARKLVTLNVSKVGRGAVTSAPAGLVCGRACSRAFVPGPVKLTAKPAKGWRFARWRGACRGTKPVCRLALSGTARAAAVFTKA